LEYEVDHIKDHRTSKKHGMQYLVSWLNYPPEEDSWELAEYLKGAQEAIDQYWKSESARKAANPARTTRVRNTRSS
jgi:hypothetical protein